MSDITREEAIKILKDTLYDEKTPTDYLKAVRMGREALENQKTGHWIKEWHIDRFEYVCSECDCGEEFQTHYCPSCGAKMEGDTEQ